jgi:TetR/AcrR family transcriptional regulator, cholesterol catabolism regulator
VRSAQKRQAGNGVRTKASNSPRMEILNAGAELIVERGYEAFTMRAVASLVNVKAGSIYYHFASKNEIVEELLNTGIARLLEYVRRVLGELPSEALVDTRVEAAVIAHVPCMVGLHRDLLQIY